MNRLVKVMHLALTALALTGVLAAQQFTPKTIQFTGVPEFNTNELLAAAQLTPGATLQASELDKHTKLLMDSGMFGSYSYSFEPESETLIFKLTPSSNLYAVRYTNLPIELTPQVMANIHARAPLFHDKLPNAGGTLDAVIAALQAEFTSRGIHATVTPSPYFDPELNSVTAIQITVTQPAVVIGVLNVEGVSPQLADALKKIYAPFTGTSFNSNESISTLQQRLESFYTDRGYANVKVKVAQASEPVLTADKIEVPFNVKIVEGHTYKIGFIKLNSKIQIQQTKIDNALHPHAGDPVTGANLRDLMTIVASTYKARGYLKCKVTPKVIADEKSDTADYQIDVDPGPLYTMGDVAFEGFPEDLALALKNNWSIPAGAPVNFPYAYSYVVKFSQHDQSTTSRLAGAKMGYVLTADPKTHVVKIIYRLEQ